MKETFHLRFAKGRNMEAKTYLQLREDIRSGDCILWQSKGFVPWLIMRLLDHFHKSDFMRAGAL